jgi:DNA modification methylase
MNNIHHSLQSLAINIDKLSFLEGNPRQGDIEAVAKSYKQFGQRKPIVATTDHVVIAGNHQLAAARQLGWDEIAVVITDDDELTAKAFALADNRTAELGSYDDDLLADLLSEVSSVPELMDSTGFSEDDLFDLIGFDDEPEEEQEIEVPVEPTTKLGDMYKLGNHYLLCGDATKQADKDKLIKDKNIDIVLTDPPYGMFLNTDYSSMKGKINDKGLTIVGTKFKPVIGDNEDFKPELITTIFSINAKEIFVWGFDYFVEYIPNRNDGSILVWDKREHENLDKRFGSSFELCFSKQKHKRDIIRYMWAGAFSKNDFDKKRHHPTQKPIGLSEWILNKYSKENDIVLDLYV